MTDLATLGLAVDSRPVADASSELERVTQAAGKAERAADSFGARTDAAGKRAAAANDNVAKSAEKVDGIYAKLTRTVMAFGGALLGAFGVRAVMQMVDSWSDMSARVGIAIGDMENADAVMARLGQTARMTYSSINLTTEGFIRNSMVLKELGRSTQDQLNYTEALNNALVVSGARGRAAEFVQESLNRSMALGAMRGLELNNVLNYGGRIAEALAEELNTTTGGLRRMAQEGKITADVIYNTLTKRMEQLREEAESMPATIEDAFTLIGNATLQFVGSLDQALGASESLAGALIVLSDNIGRIITTAATAVTMYGTYYVAAFVAANLATMTLTGALIALRAALIRTGIGAIVVVLGEFVYQLIEARRHTESWGDAFADVFDRAKAVATAFQYGFEAMVATLQSVWATFLADLVQGFESAFGGILRAFGVGVEQMSGVVAQLRNEAALAEDLAGASGRLAAGAWRHAFRPREESVTLPGGGGGGSSSPVTDGKAAKEAERLAKAYEDIVEGAQRYMAVQEMEASLMGLSGPAAAAYRHEFELLNAAKQAGIEITPALREEFATLAEGMAMAEMAVEGARLQLELMNDPFTQVAQQIQHLDGLLAAGAISWEQYGDAAFRANMLAASSSLDLAGQLTGALGQMFAENKAVAVAGAIINTAQAITKTLAQYGATPWGLAAAGVAAASGAAQIATIMSTNRGGGSRPSVGGGASRHSAPQQQQSGQTVNLRIQGVNPNQNYSGEQVKALMDEMVKLQRDGHQLVIVEN